MCETPKESLLDGWNLEKLNTALDNFERGDRRRARLSFMLGNQFHLEYTKTGNVDALDVAISLHERAISELQNQHYEDAADYAVILAHATREKASMSKTLEDADRYISAIRVKMEMTRRGPLHDESIYELGCAHSARYELTQADTDLNQAIEIVQNYVNVAQTAKPRFIFSLSTLLHHRFAKMGDPDDIDRAINLQSLALSRISADDPLRLEVLARLAQCNYSSYEHAGNAAILDKVIDACDQGLTCSVFTTAYTRSLRHLLHKALMLQYFRRPSPSELQAAVFANDSSVGNVGDTPMGAAQAVSNEATNVTSTCSETCLHFQLSVPKREIRLLSLEPGLARDPIQCSLFTVHLDSAPDYEVKILWNPVLTPF